MWLKEIKLGVYVGDCFILIKLVVFYVLCGKGLFFLVIMMILVFVVVVGVFNFVIVMLLVLDGWVDVVILVVVCLVGVEIVYKVGGV